jgi:hypothetical protein
MMIELEFPFSEGGAWASLGSISVPDTLQPPAIGQCVEVKLDGRVGVFYIESYHWRIENFLPGCAELTMIARLSSSLAGLPSRRRR